MIRKTKKNRKFKINIRKKGGATKKLPGVTYDTTLEEFENKWDVFYISAHGGILNDTINLSKNTYILNTAPTTEVCRMHPDLKRFGILYDNNDKSVISYKENFMNFAKKPRTLVPFLYKRSQIIEYKPANSNIPLVTSIYESGDEIYDMSFAFSSHVVKNENQATKGITHFIVPGIFKLPISKYVKNVRNELLKDTRGKVKEKLPSKELEKVLETANTTFINLEENLLKDIKSELGVNKNELLLSDILNSSKLQPDAGKKRLILIHACKVILEKHNEEHKKAHRRFSVGRIIQSELNRAKQEINQSEWNIARNIAGQKISNKSYEELEEEERQIEEAKQLAKEAKRLAEEAKAAKKVLEQKEKRKKKSNLLRLLEEEGINV
jgi:hypothetical protein